MKRTLRMSAFGGIFAGPALSTWYRFIDRKVTTTNRVQGLVTKVVLDQFVFAPFFIAAFFTGQGLFEGKSINEIKEKLSSGYTTALIGNYKVRIKTRKKYSCVFFFNCKKLYKKKKIWPAVQIANFYFTPLNYRLMVTNVVALGWNAYLSTINSRS